MEIGGALAEAAGTSKGDAGAGEKGADFEKAKVDVQSQRNDGQVKLEYDISKGTLEVDPGRADKPPYTMKGTSGRDECMNDPDCADKRDEGPIPPGDYTIDSSKVNDSPFWKDLGRTMKSGDYGDFLVPLEPSESNETFGRDGFYLHGGRWEGSKGCIDVGGGIFGDDRTNGLVEDLMGDADGTVEVKVLAGDKED